MTAAELLSDLTTLGIQLEADGERLRYWPRAAVTPELMTMLKAHKPTLMTMLKADTGTTMLADIEPIATPQDALPCDRCGCRTFIDVAIHGGQSTRRDCTQCHRTVTFPIWYGRAI